MKLAERGNLVDMTKLRFVMPRSSDLTDNERKKLQNRVKKAIESPECQEYYANL